MAKADKKGKKDDKKKVAKAPVKPAAKAKPAAKPAAKTAKAPVKPAVAAKPTAKDKPAAKAAAKAPAKPVAKPAAKPAPKAAARPAAKPVAKTATKPAPKAAAKPVAKAAPAKPAPVAAKPAAAKPALKVVPPAKPAAPAKTAAKQPEPKKPEPKKPEPFVKKPAVLLKPIKQINPLEPPANPNILIHGQKPYIARPGEEYMSAGQIEHFRKILGAWKRELMEEVDRTVTHMQDESANLPDPNDRATQEEEFALELRTRDRERKLIKKIDKTINILGDGDYGYCTACGIEIGIRRLEARPTADLCIDCKTLAEIKEKQVGSSA